MKPSISLPLAILLAVSIGFCQQNSVPLGDVARQNKPPRNTPHVITDDDLPRHADDSAPASPATGVVSNRSASGSDGGESARTDSNVSAKEKGPDTSASQRISKSASSSDVTSLKDALADVKSDAYRLANQIKALDEKLAAEDDPERQEVYRDMLKRLNASLENRKSRSADLQNKIDQLQSGKSSQ
jgi:hypothetical protein